MNSANIPLYHIFLTVARSSSISGAAKSLYISQPAVSKSIKKLEESLGVSLIKRSSKGITLTKEIYFTDIFTVLLRQFLQVKIH